MGFFDSFRGNDGFNAQAVPGPDNTPHGSEVDALEQQRLAKETIENQIVALEQETSADPDHPKYGELLRLRNELEKINPQ